MGWSTRIAIAAVLVLLTGPSEAATKKPAALENWAVLPTREEYAPSDALVRDLGVVARAVIHCGVADDGALTECRVQRETPSGTGYGEATLQLAPKYRRKPPGRGDAHEVSFVNMWYVADKAADWVRRPTASDLMTVYPTEAFRRGESGSAIINCIATVQGALADCVTLEETPDGEGFGSAAIALTPQFVMRPATFKGAPVASFVTIPINFRTSGPGETTGSKRVLPPNVAWAEAPAFVDVAAAYPKKARDAHVGGHATLSCGMGRDGRLTQCNVIASEPRSYGFDTAAKTLAKQFRLDPALLGDPKATRMIAVHLPITFDPKMIDAESPVVGKPTWSHIPDGGELTAAFRDAKVTSGGRGIISCAVQPGGYVSDCQVVSEDPDGTGVGRAALALAPIFRLATWTAEGLPVVGGTVNIPLRYDAEAKAAEGH